MLPAFQTGKPLIGIFGGTFNPVHLGHMRLVVEVMESVRPARLDLLPSARPPHKGGRRILPFDLRVAMLQAATQDLGGVRVNEMENERDAPSFTVDTLRIYKEREPDARFFFILGAEDFPAVSSWERWRELPFLADIVIVPRSGSGAEVFADTIRSLWPEAEPAETPFAAADTAYAIPHLPDAGFFIHLPLPRLDIRAELIRERFLAGRSIRFLVPETVRAVLTAHPEAAAIWRGTFFG
ncbi:MAG: putative nicotinate-nucleotide adenylyltransferase [Desulfovibrio sp.]